MKTGTMTELLADLPDHLQEVAKAIRAHVMLPSVRMSSVVMGNAEKRVTGLEISSPSTNTTSVVVLPVGDDWYIAILGEDGDDSSGGWTSPIAETTPVSVAKMVERLLSSGKN